MEKELKNIHMSGLFGKIEPTLENMNSIAQFNRVIKNYLKMKLIIKEKTTNDGR
jgi:predicted amino acid racemase